MNHYVFYFFTLIFSCTQLSAFESYHLVEHLQIEDIILKHSLKNISAGEETPQRSELVHAILKDKDKLVSPVFSVPEYFADNVSFWLRIYGQYSSNEVLIHDKRELALIYQVVDFSELKGKSQQDRFTQYHLQSALAQEYVVKIKKELNKLSRSYGKPKGAFQKNLLVQIKKSGLKLPKKKKSLRTFFKKRARDIRVQTGQRDFIFQGILNYLPYQVFLQQVLTLKGLPKELAAIPFVESSFNREALSRVDAYGIWQIMPFTKNLILPKYKGVDYRSSIPISTYAALSLLKENKLILKRWDLAITAYNSGTRHIQRAKKHLLKKGIKKHTLANILKYHQNRRLGFATKNFYSEILAMMHVLAYKKILFPVEGTIFSTPLYKGEDSLAVYVTRCTFKPKYFFKELEKQNPKIKELNNHIKVKRKSFPAGLLLVSNITLNKELYWPIATRDLKKKFPKKWKLNYPSENCSKI